MQTRTGRYLHEQRTSKGPTREQLAERIGYKNLAKGARRIQVLEEEAMALDGLLGRILWALELDPNHIEALIDQDRREIGASSIVVHTRRLWETAVRKWIWHLEPEQIHPRVSRCKPSRMLPPAATCAICDRPLGETGGKRLVACSTASIRRAAVQRPLPNRVSCPSRPPHLAVSRCHRLGGRPGLDRRRCPARGGGVSAARAFVGVPAVRQDSPLRALRNPDRSDPMSDCLYDDGRILHTAHFAGYGRPFCPTCGTKTEWIKPLGTREIAGSPALASRRDVYSL